MKKSTKQIVGKDDITIEATILSDGAIFNLQALQLLLGQTEESAKKWVKKHKVPALMGRSWLFSGRLLREALEPVMLDQLRQRADKAALKR